MARSSGRELHIDMAWLGHPDFPAYEKVLRACYDEIKKVEILFCSLIEKLIAF
jgi:hypothetical protein